MLSLKCIQRAKLINLFMNYSKTLIFLVLLATINTVSTKELLKFTISSYILPNKQLEMELDIVTPRVANNYPVMIFLTGLSGLAPSFFQEEVIESIAREGFVWITVFLKVFRSQGFKAQTLKKSPILSKLQSIGLTKISKKYSIVEFLEL